ncbi:MAG: serine/threonine protein kinase [Candidatus Aenigmarchaeota archaeon]|nr:serine/threonine protein kinase [Candidatus Aenigmarchaeota archaeon]
MSDQGLAFEVGGKRYVDGEQIGGGGMATVYSAVDIETGEVVAIKVYREDIDSRALNSSIMMHKRLIIHGDIPRLHCSDDKSYVMDYVDGVNLRNLQLSDESSVLIVGYDVAMCLLNLHENLPDPIIHRDVKPGNIVVRHDGVSVLVDFDFAHVDVLSTFRGSENVGTPMFWSPEQICGRQVKPESDIFSLGSTMYNLLTGQYLRQPHVRLAIEVALDDLQECRSRDIIARCWRVGTEYRNAFFLSEDIHTALEESGVDIEGSRRALADLVKESKHDSGADNLYEGVG